MNKTIILLLFLIIGFVSCKNSKKQIDNIEIAKQYFKVLDDSHYSNVSNWFPDSLTTIEGKHKKAYSKSDYIEFLKWDSVFEPSYKILAIEQKNGLVKAKISKMDKRISFLHEEPFITNEIIEINNTKIIRVETEYVNFNEATWGRNKNRLLTWIDKNHPELNGFIYDQTESGGIKFLQAIEMYKTKAIY
ncbi:hypothetical protein Q4512_12740 [Oceanihabitans sp. 2_MG-2023]|uniref:hypothetical protein n=1 Tax=Oceanihabitans sp. 2_MG-2023 TaxID=3062661 RepID=UPI0026E22EC3|nr:hypothetical protein [Oceanihabitans sp. 2_MG-2023]MDO6597784.1 hypothetical protein [Oceanihabitans sp. 2_MG-2023]